MNYNDTGEENTKYKLKKSAMISVTYNNMVYDIDELIYGELGSFHTYVYENGEEIIQIPMPWSDNARAYFGRILNGSLLSVYYNNDWLSGTHEEYTIQAVVVDLDLKQVLLNKEIDVPATSSASSWLSNSTYMAAIKSGNGFLLCFFPFIGSELECVLYYDTNIDEWTIYDNINGGLISYAYLTNDVLHIISESKNVNISKSGISESNNVIPIGFYNPFTSDWDVSLTLHEDGFTVRNGIAFGRVLSVQIGDKTSMVSGIQSTSGSQVNNKYFVANVEAQASGTVTNKQSYTNPDFIYSSSTPLQGIDSTNFEIPSGIVLFNGMWRVSNSADGETIEVGSDAFAYPKYAQVYINGIRTPFRKYNPDTGVWERLDNFFGEE